MTARVCADYNLSMITEKMSLYDYMRAYRPKKGEGTAFIRGGKKMTFAKLFKEVERVAGGLAALGVGRGDVVMLALPTIGVTMVNPALSWYDFHTASLRVFHFILFHSEEEAA